MANDPNYVRLADRLARGCRVDINSGWSIAGLDVREFPASDYPLAQQFVRTELARGNLEVASAAEYEEVNDGDDDFLGAAGVDVTRPTVEGHYQESHVVGAADEKRRSIEASRGFGDGGQSYKDDLKRRRAIAKAQEKLDNGDDLDDDNEYVGAPDGGDGGSDGADGSNDGQGGSDGGQSSTSGSASAGGSSTKKAPAKKTASNNS